MSRGIDAHRDIMGCFPVLDGSSNLEKIIFSKWGKIPCYRTIEIVYLVSTFNVSSVCFLVQRNFIHIVTGYTVRR